MSTPKKEKLDWPAAVIFAVTRLCDAGLFPWAVIATAGLGALALLTHNLDSHDTLKFLTHVASFRGIAWFGWVIAFLEIPITRWIIDRKRRQHQADTRELRSDNERTRRSLRKGIQPELDLTVEKPEE